MPPHDPIASAEEHAARFPAAVAEYMAYLRDHDILTVRDFMEPSLRARIGRFRPGPRECFTEVDFRDPVVMRTHGYHLYLQQPACGTQQTWGPKPPGLHSEWRPRFSWPEPVEGSLDVPLQRGQPVCGSPGVTRSAFW